MIEKIVFVYYLKSSNKIKVLTPQEDKEIKNELLNNGWVHTATLNVSEWIEYLFNQAMPEEIIECIIALSKKPSQ